MTAAESGSRSVDILCVPAERVPAFWPHVSVMEAYYIPGQITEAEVYAKLLAGKYQLWIAWDDGIVGAAMTEIRDYPGYTAVRIVALTAKGFTEWMREAEPVIIDFGRIHGATKIEIEGRKGWQRMLPDYSLVSITMEKVIE